MKHFLPHRPTRRGGIVSIAAMLTVLMLAGSSIFTCHAMAETPADVPAIWWGEVQHDIANREYRVTWQEACALPADEAQQALTYDTLRGEGFWQAPNRTHNLRTYFSQKGPRVVSRDEADWLWGLELLDAPSVESTNATGNRIEFHRAGGLVEWYVNDAKGLEQNFTVAEPQDSQGAEIVLEIAVRGNLHPEMSSDKAMITFLSDDLCEMIHYGGLRAWDASGRDLAASMDLLENGKAPRIRLTVNTAGAVYPVTIDPLATSANWSADGEQPWYQFGFNVASAGDVNGDGFNDLIVSAEKTIDLKTYGQAYLYMGSSSGIASTPGWTADFLEENGLHLGRVASAGDVNGDGYSDVILSAYIASPSDVNRVYVLHGSVSGLASTPAWSLESDPGESLFISDVASAGDVNGDGFSDVIIGSPLHVNTLRSEGRAVVYLGSSTGLETEPVWSVHGDQEGAQFGLSVAGAGDVNGDGFSDIIVGAPEFSCLYLGSASGPSTERAWTSVVDQYEERSISSVASAGDINGDGFSDVLVGSMYYTTSQTYQVGRVHAFYGSGTGLTSEPAWTAVGDQHGSCFGACVASAGDVNGDGYADIIFGATNYDNVAAWQGKAFVYFGSASGLSDTPAWTGENDKKDSSYGLCVASAGDVNGDGLSDIIVSAPFYDIATANSNEGRVYAFYGSTGGLSSEAGWTAAGEQSAGGFGDYVATAGDVNGDGFSDAIIGALDYDNGQVNEGMAFVYHGSAAGLETEPAWTAEGNQADAHFGIRASSAGDVNGDGYGDVIIGATAFDGDQSDEGRAFVYHGSPLGLAADPDWTVESDQEYSAFGTVASAGDINGDGYGDVIVGAGFFDNGEENEGRVFAYYGSPSGLSDIPGWVTESNLPLALFGIEVAAAGDVNGDGYSDVIIGASGFNNGEPHEGRVYVYHGSAAGLASEPAWIAEGNQEGAVFGGRVAPAGDVNGDGFDDVIVGAFFYDDGEADEGKVFVYYGSNTGLHSAPDWHAQINLEGAMLGTSVASAGDINGDGFSDIIVEAAFFLSTSEPSQGRFYVYQGSAAGLSSTASWTLLTDKPRMNYGQSAATAGDVNGDGYDDIIVGVPDADAPNGDGKVFVYYGNGGTGMGLSLQPRMRMIGNSRPVAPLGKIRNQGIGLSAIGRTPFGRGFVKLECEIKPSGVAFDGRDTHVSADWTDTSLAGTELAEEIEGLDSGLYHWRARLLYHRATIPYQPASRWFTSPSNAWDRSTFRVIPESTARPNWILYQ